MGKKEDLGYYWRAEFDDAHTINQFDGEVENKFQEVLDYSETLEMFSVISVSDPNEEYIVDLVNKTIETPHKNYSVTGSAPELIYKRRNQVRAEVGKGTILSARVTHILGIKTSTQEQQIEILNPVGMVEKKVKFKNKKDKTEEVLV